MRNVKREGQTRRRWAGLALALVATAMIAVPTLGQVRLGRVTNLPVPRFVSLNDARVNVRAGAGEDYPIQWIFVRRGYPVEVIEEFDNWRQIRDADGSTGWVYYSLLSSRRTGMVLPTSDGAPVPLRSGPSLAAGVTAQLEPGVMAPIDQCAEGWCRMISDRFTGWIEQERLWGVYIGETF